MIKRIFRQIENDRAMYLFAVLLMLYTAFAPISSFYLPIVLIGIGLMVLRMVYLIAHDKEG